ncbi:MAG: hypothetical protein COV46_06140 [Deltaproteobacteria bacterium CG11_big_fil_rev_8_21_14_0_20_49_13]|nr:MAG: hypothetical protein COV46_06140 [Deltaproteobacteria bacterium CG11_big_fil_rev_8_21_14_0_20_49_13]
MTIKYMRERIYRKITSFIVRRWALILIAGIGLTAFCYPYTARLFGNISTDLIKLLPKDYDSVKQLEKLRTMFEGGSSLSVILESDNPEKTRDAVRYVATELLKDPTVGDVRYKKTGYDFFDKHKLLFLDLDDLETIRDRMDRRIQREKLGSFYIDFEDDGADGGGKNEEFKFGDLETKYKTRYTSGVRNEYVTDDEGRVYTITVDIGNRAEDFPAFTVFLNHIKERVAGFDLKSFDPTMEVYYSGTIRNRLDEYNTLIHDLKVAGMISGIGIFLLLAVYFRRPFSVVIIFAPLAAGIICSFAFAYIFIRNLNVVTSFLFAVLGGLGVEVGIHMFSRYIEERSEGKSIEDAIFAILYFTGRSAITAGLTVAATFLILVVNDFKGFSEFGFITGSGILIVYVMYHLLFPPVLIAAEKLRLLRFKKIVHHDLKILEKKFPCAKAVLAASAAIFVLSAAALPFVGFEYDFAKLKSHIPSGKTAKEKLRLTMPTVNRPAVIFINDLDDALAVKEYIKQKREEDEASGHRPILDVYKSWYDVVQYNQDEKMKVIGEIKHLLADKTLKLVKGEHKKDLDRFKEVLNETVPIKEDEVPPKVKEAFFGMNPIEGEQLSYINAEPNLELDNGLNAIEFAERIEKMDTPRGAFYGTSDAVVFADVLRTMLKDVPRVVILSFLIVFFFVWLDFRDLRKAALVMSPIVVGVVIMFGIMFVLKMKLNFFNMIVVPTVFGTSIDNSIHIYHRYEEMGKKSLMKVLKTSGGAALMSSMTNILGFLGLVFANHSGLSSIGKLAIAGMSGCLFTTLIYFPAALQWLSDRRSGRASS